MHNFSDNYKAFLLADAKQPLLNLSVLHISVFHDRPNRGHKFVLTKRPDKCNRIQDALHVTQLLHPNYFINHDLIFEGS